MDPKAKSNPFEELWTIFPRKHHRSKAQAAYKALAPDAELHANLMASAIAWAAHYERTGTDKRWWKHLHTWLIEERYLEDVPEPYENPKEAAIARARERGPKKASAQSKDIDGDAPAGRHEVMITDFKTLDDAWSDEQRFSLSYRIRGGKHDGKEFSHMFVYWAYDNDAVSDKGKKLLADIYRAVGKTEESDFEHLYDVPLCAVVSNGGAIRYESLQGSVLHQQSSSMTVSSTDNR